MHDIHVYGNHWWLSCIESDCETVDAGLVPGSERPPGQGNDNPLQYSCLGNPKHRGAWWVIVLGVIRAQHDLATKPPPSCVCIYIYIHIIYMYIHLHVSMAILTPERIKEWSQSKNNTQLWMCLVTEARSDTVKSNIA